MSQPRKLEILANAATVVIGLVLSAVLVKAFQLKQPSNRPLWTYCQPGRGISLKDYFPGVDWAKNGRTVILALSTSSRYCSDSAEFYQRIDRERAKDVKLLAIFREPVGVARKFLQEREIHVDDVRQVILQGMAITGTPVLMLLDDSGTIIDAWLGKLPVNEEDEVIAAVKQSAVPRAQVAEGPRARRVEINEENRRDPVKFVNITEAGQDVLPGRYSADYLPGKPFLAGDNWIKDLSFTLKNRTSKKIVCLGFTFYFAEEDIASLDDRVLYGYSAVTLGEIPEITFGAFNLPGEVIPKGTGKPLQFAPGTEMTISLAGEAKNIRIETEDRRGKPFAAVKKFSLLLVDVYFEDGMRCGKASPTLEYQYVDKRVPDSWIPMDPRYFPGELNPMSWLPSELVPLTPDEDED